MKFKTIYFTGCLVLFLLATQTIIPQSSGGPYAITQSVVANGGGAGPGSGGGNSGAAGFTAWLN